MALPTLISRAGGRGALAVVLNGIVMAPALLLGDADVVAKLVFLASVSAFACVEARGGRALEFGDGRVPWSAVATGLVTLALFCLAALTTRAASPLAAPVVGASSMALGIALRHLAMKALGSGFRSEVWVAPRLVDEGIYRRMRHPSELGLLALTLGAAICFASVAAIVVWAIVLVPLVLLRVRAEDRQLRLLFGPTHAAYCRRVGSFG